MSLQIRSFDSGQFTKAMHDGQGKVYEVPNGVSNRMVVESKYAKV